MNGAVVPNIGRRGRRRRAMLAMAAGAAAVALLVTAIATGLPWTARLAVFFPAAIAAGSALQVRRRTCVRHAAFCTIEHDRGPATAANPVDAAASRRVAATIVRDGALIGLVVAVLSALSALAA